VPDNGFPVKPKVSPCPLHGLFDYPPHRSRIHKKLPFNAKTDKSSIQTPDAGQREPMSHWQGQMTLSDTSTMPQHTFNPCGVDDKPYEVVGTTTSKKMHAPSNPYASSLFCDAILFFLYGPMMVLMGCKIKSIIN
jgi:hypothetical protein